MTRISLIPTFRTCAIGKRLTPLIALMLTLWLVYAAGLHGGFIFDDIANLVQDTNWRLTEWTSAQIKRAVSYGISSPSGRPLALLSFALNHYWFGSDPYWLKVGNLLLHMTNTVLAWLLVHRLLTLMGFGAKARSLAIWIAAAWALHPLQVSTVLYVVQRMEVGAATGTLLALYAYLRSRTMTSRSPSQWGWAVMAVAALICGLLFKETTVLTFGFAFLLEIFFLRFRNSDGSLSIGWIALYLLGAVTALLVVWLWIWPSPESYATRNFDVWERLLTQGPVLVMYLGQILAPLPNSMRFYYDDFPISTSLFNPPHTLLAWSIICGLCALAWSCRKRWPLTAFGISWFFVSHALTSGFIPLELAFEHRNYLSIFGILIAIVEPAFSLFRRIGPDIGKAVAVLVLLMLVLLTHVQALTWGNPATLALSLELRAPGSQRAAYSLGTQLFEAADQDPSSPYWSLARRQWERANELPGELALPLVGILLLDGQSGTTIPHEAWNELRARFSRRAMTADHENGLQMLINCRVDKRCQFDDEELLGTILLALEHNPQGLMLHMMLAHYAWHALNDRTLALSVQREAVALAPNDPGQRLALAAYLIATGDADASIEAALLVKDLEQADHDGRLAEALTELRSLLTEPDLRDGGSI